MKIALKTSENHSKVSENHSKKSENHSNRVNFTFWGSSQRDTSFVLSCPSVRSPLNWNSLYWSDFHSFWSDFHFGMIFTRFESDFHSVRVFLMLFTLLENNHFTHFTLREYYPFTCLWQELPATKPCICATLIHTQWLCVSGYLVSVHLGDSAVTYQVPRFLLRLHGIGYLVTRVSNVLIFQ